jgi:PAS domain S-box-containing protein
MAEKPTYEELEKRIRQLEQVKSEHNRTEVELCENEERYRTIIQTAMDGFWLTDTSGNFLEVNAAYAQMSGYSIEELMCMKISNIEASENPEDVARHIQKGVETGFDRFETVHRKKDKSTFDVEVNFRYFPMEGGRFVVFLRDITDRTKVETLLRESEEKYRTLFETMTQGVVYQDSDGKVISANPSAEKLLGLSLDQLKGRTSLDIRWKTVREDGSDFPGEAHPAMEALRTGAKINNVTMGVFNPVEKRRSWLNINAVPQFREGENRPYQVYTTFHDITDRKRAEKSLIESETRYRSLVELSPEAVFVHQKGFIKYINRRGAEIFGATDPEELIGKPAMELIHPDCHEVVYSRIERVYKDRTTLPPQELKYVRLDKEVIDVEATGTYIEYSGKPATLSVIRDITERKQAEEALGYERDLIERMMETSPAGIVRTDVDGKILYANIHAEKILGVQLSENNERIYNDPAWKIKDFHGNPFPDENLPFYLVKKTGKTVFGIQHAIEWPNGKRVLLSINAAPLRDESRIFEGMVATIEDITDKYESEQKYQMLFREMIDGFALHEIICDDRKRPFDYRFLAVNPAFERLTGLKGESLVGKTVLEVMPDIESTWIERYGQVALTGQSTFFENYSQELDRHFQVTAFRPAQNQFACIFVDISERKISDEALRNSEKKYRLLFEESNDGIFLHDMEGYILDTNTKAQMMLGYKKEELNRLSISMLHPESVLAVSGRAIEETERKGNTNFETQFVKKDGTVIDVDISSSLVDSNKGLVQGIVRDITDRKQLEARLQQAQKMEAIGTLAGGIAHDFNNILTPFIIHTEMAMMDIPDGYPVQNNLKEALKAGYRARDLVKQILAFSRRQDIEAKPIEVSIIVKEALKLLRASIPTTIDIQLKLTAKSDTILADPTQIHQIIMNLCTNATHAMSERDGILGVKTDNQTIDHQDKDGSIELLPGEYLKLSISDTGHGIEPAILQRIFDPYYTTKDKHHGTGLGLSVVHGIVKALDGEITVTSKPGEGSTFTLYFPLVVYKENDGATSIAAKALPVGNERILLIDDEKAMVDAVQTMLERLGYQVTNRTSSMGAFETFKSKPDAFDLIITDQTMPNMTGKKLAKEIMSIRPDIPIIICTGFSEQIDENQAKEMGIRAFVMKPIVMKDMANTIRTVLDSSTGTLKN